MKNINYRTLYNAMDDWVVVKTNDEDEKITRIIMKKNQGENRMETIDWE